MSRNVKLDNEAVAALEAYRRGGESFSQVVKRLCPPPIKTLGDLEAFLEQLDGPLFSELARLEKLRGQRAKKALLSKLSQPLETAGDVLAFLKAEAPPQIDRTAAKALRRGRGRRSSRK